MSAAGIAMTVAAGAIALTGCGPGAAPTPESSPPSTSIDRCAQTIAAMGQQVALKQVDESTTSDEWTRLVIDSLDACKSYQAWSGAVQAEPLAFGQIGDPSAARVDGRNLLEALCRDPEHADSTVCADLLGTVGP